MKKLIILLLLTVTFLFGCEKENAMDFDAYANDYTQILIPLESHLDENYYREMCNVLTPACDLTFYSHKDFMNYMNQISDDLSEELYLLSELGPSITDETLQMLQSDLEVKLANYKEVIDRHKTGYNFDTVVPSRFPFKEDLYMFYEEWNDIQEDILNITYEIEALLMDKGVVIDETYLSLKLRNMLRFDYTYAILGSHASTYQDATGLPVQPARTDFILDKDQYRRVLEIDPLIMDQISAYLNKQFDFYLNYDLSLVPDTKMPEALKDLVENYNDYLEIRNTLSDDFFTSGEYKEYQTLKMRNTDMQYFDYTVIMNPELTNLNYDFDESYYEDYHFDDLTTYYWHVQHALFSKQHYDRMWYEDLYKNIEFPVWME